MNDLLKRLKRTHPHLDAGSILKLARDKGIDTTALAAMPYNQFMQAIRDLRSKEFKNVS